MKIKHLILFSIILVAQLSTIAQSGKKDTIYLKNGSIILGTIIEQVPGKTYKILTSDNNTFTYSVDEIEKITSNVETAPTPIATQVDAPIVLISGSSQKDSEFKNKGFTVMARFGPLGLRSVTGGLAAGYQVNHFLFAGLGVNIDAYKTIGNALLEYNYKGMDVFAPIYADIHMFSSENRVAFMWHFSLGYSVLAKSTNRYMNKEEKTNNMDKTINGGAYYGTGIGLRVFATKSLAILMEFGFKIQNYQEEQRRMLYDYSYNYNYDYNTGNYNYYGARQYEDVKQFSKTAITPFVNIGLKF